MYLGDLLPSIVDVWQAIPEKKMALAARSRYTNPSKIALMEMQFGIGLLANAHVSKASNLMILGCARVAIWIPPTGILVPTNVHVFLVSL